MDKDIKFCTIDFETATGKRDSACAVGIVTFVNGEIVDEYAQLIRPPNNFYSPRNIEVHGITPRDTMNAPLFRMVYKDIKARLEGQPVVAHNCFSGDIKYITKDGIKSFYETVNTEQFIWSKNEWKLAKVNEYDKTHLSEIVVKPYNRSRSSIVHKLKVTRNHRMDDIQKS